PGPPGLPGSGGFSGSGVYGAPPSDFPPIQSMGQPPAMQPPPMQARMPEPPMMQPPPPSGGGGSGYKKPLWIGALLGIVIAVAGAAFIVNAIRKRNAEKEAANHIAVQIATAPQGAAVSINGQARCTSECNLTLEPGNYQVTASLDGYEPATSSLNL